MAGLELLVQQGLDDNSRALARKGEQLEQLRLKRSASWSPAATGG